MRPCHPYFYGTIEQLLLHRFAVSWLQSAIRFSHFACRHFSSRRQFMPLDYVGRITSMAFAVGSYTFGFASLGLAAALLGEARQKILAND
jgi:hypothetical protein